MTEQLGPRPGKTYRSPINVIGAKFADVNVPSLGYRIDNVAIREQPGEIWPLFSVVARSEDDTWEKLYVKMEMNVTALSIGTFTQCWLSEIDPVRIYLR